MKNTKFDLEERLINYAVKTIAITESLFNTRAGNYIASQLVRSCTSPALHYGEAQSAESRNDFIHKIKILLKELHESMNSLRIVNKVPLTDKTEEVGESIVETNELISIFVKSIQTAKANNQKRK